ncbi:MAG: hypothetical protein AB1347_02840, partial [Acidobacteriota bacterium]
GGKNRRDHGRSARHLQTPRQDHRAPGSDELLHRILESIGRNRPAYFRRRVRIAAVLVPETASLLAESCRRLMDTGVAEIRLQTAAGADLRWKPDDEALLFRQMEEAALEAARRYGETGRIPLEFLRPRGDGAPAGDPGDSPCNVRSGESLFVDPWGVAWTCPLFAASLVREPALVQGVQTAVCVGPADSPALSRRLEVARAAAMVSPVFSPGTGKGAERGPCRDCHAEPHCRSCPAVRFLYALGGEGSAPPPFHCAFERAAALGRRRFVDGTGPIPAPSLAAAVALARRWFDGAGAVPPRRAGDP